MGVLQGPALSWWGGVEPVPGRGLLLGGAGFGVAAAVGDGVRVPVDVPALAPSVPVHELWSVPGPVRVGARGALRYAHDDELLFFAVEQAAGTGAMQGATLRAYDAVFDALDALGFPALLRVWNHVPAINRVDDGLERYRQFNVGRQLAFERHGRMRRGAAVPAASAVGAAADAPLAVFGLAGRVPGVGVENPRQVSACDYPQQYGPRAPTFARATAARVGGQALLFISGTASIVGHVSLHGGDVAAQTRETLRNIAAVLDAAAALGLRLRPEELAYKVYLRDAADLDAVRALLREAAGDAAPALFLQADICRAELSVEIEAVGIAAAGATP